MLHWLLSLKKNNEVNGGSFNLVSIYIKWLVHILKFDSYSKGV